MVQISITKADIADEKEISILGKVISERRFDDGNELYKFIDLIGNVVSLKIWEKEADKYDISVGNWYYFQDAEGNTFDEPMISSNRGKMGVAVLGGVDPHSVPFTLPEVTATDITNEEQVSILGKITGGQTFKDGNQLYTVEDISGTEFSLKVWSSEARNYTLRVGSWYLFEDAMGDTLNEPQISSNHGNMLDIPLSKAPRSVRH